jgi:uncharacterized membrane protein YtjA (UPF0391 family)
MITLALLFLVAAIVFLGLWISGVVVTFVGVAKLLFLISISLFVIFLAVGVVSKPPKV